MKRTWKIILLIATALAILFVLINLLFAIIPNVKKLKVFKEEHATVYRGEVINKEILNPSFFGRPMTYQIVIQDEGFEYEGEKYVNVQRISVDKEIYMEIEIGDIFDSQTLEIIKR